MKIIISRQELLAALLFASSDDSRFTLASVCVEVRPNKSPTVIATDGRRLVVIESQAVQADDFSADFQMLLRADFVRPVCALSKALGGKLFPWIQFEVAKDGIGVTATLIGGNCFLEAEANALVAGEFPKWRACVPDKKSPRTQINDLAVNAEFVGDFAKAAKIFDVDKVIQMNLVGKDSAVEVKIPRVDYFYGLVMPCKPNEDVDYQPEFLGIVENLPVRVANVNESPEAESELPPGTVTIKTGGKSVTVTTKQFSKAANKLAKKSRAAKSTQA